MEQTVDMTVYSNACSKLLRVITFMLHSWANCRLFLSLHFPTTKRKFVPIFLSLQLIDMQKWESGSVSLIRFNDFLEVMAGWLLYQILPGLFPNFDWFMLNESVMLPMLLVCLNQPLQNLCSLHIFLVQSSAVFSPIFDAGTTSLRGLMQ